MATKHKNRIERQTADQRLMLGFQKHQAALLQGLFLDGAYVAVADIVSFLGEGIASADRVTSQRAAWLAAATADRGRRAKNKAFLASLRHAVRLAFPNAIDTLADFGLAPHKARVVSPEDKQKATAKALATRAARHTMGSRQREKVKGAPPEAVSPTTATPPADHAV